MIFKNLFRRKPKEPKVWSVCIWQFDAPALYELSEKEYEALMRTKLPPFYSLMSAHRIHDGR